jgi:hypothetical protein
MSPWSSGHGAILERPSGEQLDDHESATRSHEGVAASAGDERILLAL